jgi:hypothetical protein
MRLVDHGQLSKLQPIQAEEEREACALLVEAFAANYPVDLFPPVGEEECSRDRVAAHMARHLCKVLAADIRARDAR